MGRGRKFNPEKMSNKRGGGRNRIESDDEEDEDSEMDDFIDDSEAKMDISAEIRSIFGYDRRRSEFNLKLSKNANLELQCKTTEIEAHDLDFLAFFAKHMKIAVTTPKLF